MCSKMGLVFLLTAMLLTVVGNGLNWQGAGSMNHTVIAKVWENLESNLQTAFNTNGAMNVGNNPVNLACKSLSDKLNNGWSPAWNVVVLASPPQYDTVLYGYAFNDHWMWYNGVPVVVPAIYGSKTMVTLIVWKDYNCANWNYIGNYDQTISQLTTQQKSQISTEVRRLTEDKIINDIWGAAHDFLTSLQAPESAFYYGGYAIIMSQAGSVNYYGRVCRVGNQYFFSGVEYDQLIVGSTLGSFYLFQTRSGL